MAEQINVFVDNKPGRIKTITKILCDNEINLRALSIQDRGDFGVMKLTVDDPAKAKLALIDSGFACASKQVLAIVVDDKPGGLYRLTDLLSAQNINIKDAYGFTVDARKTAICCLEVDDPDRTRTIIEQHGFKVLSDGELYEL